MKKSVFIVSAFILLSQSAVLSQTAELRSAFVSANVGVFVTANANFSKVYDSKAGFVFGGGIGLPLSTRAYLYGKVTYFSKSGVPVIYTYTYQNGNLVSITETKGGTATFKQWIFNGGIQYNIFLSEDFTLGITGGIAYSRFSEEQRSPASSLTSTIDGTGVFGFFGGIGIEKNFQGSPFSVFAEAQYNYSRRDLVGVVGDYGGLNLDLGIRYYFKDRRTQ
jgi:hypothetical protein